MITFLSLGKYGRFGNQLFQIASTIGIATKNNHGFIFPYWKNYDHLERFGSDENIDIQSYFFNPLPNGVEGRMFLDRFIQWGYHDVKIHPDQNVSLSGHMQSEKYFLHCENLIKHFFTLKHELPQNDYCAIHIRLGDYDDNYHPIQKMDYYDMAMSYLPANTKYLVFSDDIKKAKTLFGNNVDYSEPKHYMEDFALMKSCKNFIIANSTYSWWAAWLSNSEDKKVFAPSKWFGPVANLNASDIYCANWTKI